MTNLDEILTKYPGDTIDLARCVVGEALRHAAHECLIAYVDIIAKHDTPNLDPETKQAFQAQVAARAMMLALCELNDGNGWCGPDDIDENWIVDEHQWRLKQFEKPN